jgi:hypothetical protein
MARHLHCYVFDEEDLGQPDRKLTKRLQIGSGPLPEYAGTEQRIAEVTVDGFNRIPQRIIRAEGFYYAFDPQGRLDWARSRRIGWPLTEHDLDVLMDEIFGGQRRDETLQSDDGDAAGAPVRNARVHACFDVIDGAIKQIYLRMAELSEGELHALAIDVRDAGRSNFHDPILLGFAELATRHCRTLMHHRTGSGAWIAAVEATEWEEARRPTRKSSILASERCASRPEAVDAARRLLEEHTMDVTARVAIESVIYCEAEWQTRERADDHSGGSISSSTRRDNCAKR